jgi:hypothetical protein
VYNDVSMYIVMLVLRTYICKYTNDNLHKNIQIS